MAACNSTGVIASVRAGRHAHPPRCPFRRQPAETRSACRIVPATRPRLSESKHGYLDHMRENRHASIVARRPRRDVYRSLLALVLLCLAITGIVSDCPRSPKPADQANTGAVHVQLTRPDVPANVVDSVRAAEDNFYQQLSGPRRLAEDAQEVVSRMSPTAAYHFDFSIGPHRVKPQTIHGLLPYAESKGYLLPIGPRTSYERLLPTLSHHEGHSEWQVCVILAHLREQHPDLRTRSWADIAGDPSAIAKLYSGYTGAGGAQELWCADDDPGPVARSRLGFDEATGRYANVLPPR